MPKFVESGLIEPWDTARIDAYGDLNADLTGTDVAAGEAVYFLPTDYGSTAIAYDSDQVPAEDVASLDVFVNPKYQGRMAIPDNVDDAYALAYLATGTTDWTTATDAQFEAASDWLREVHPYLRTYWTDPGELAQLLQSGEVLVAWAWNETLPTLSDEGFPIGFQREAAEGSSLWLCGYVNMGAVRQRRGSGLRLRQRDAGPVHDAGADGRRLGPCQRRGLRRPGHAGHAGGRRPGPHRRAGTGATPDGRVAAREAGGDVRADQGGVLIAGVRREGEGVASPGD